MITWILLPTSDAATSVSCQDFWPKSYRKRTNVLHIDVTARLESVTILRSSIFIFFPTGSLATPAMLKIMWWQKKSALFSMTIPTKKSKMSRQQRRQLNKMERSDKKIKFVIASAIADRNNKTGEQNCGKEK